MHNDGLHLLWDATIMQSTHTDKYFIQLKENHLVHHFNPQHIYYFSEESWKLRESCLLVGVYVSCIIIFYVSSFSLCAFVNSFL